MTVLKDPNGRLRPAARLEGTPLRTSRDGPTVGLDPRQDGADAGADAGREAEANRRPAGPGAVALGTVAADEADADEGVEVATQGGLAGDAEAGELGGGGLTVAGKGLDDAEADRVGDQAQPARMHGGIVLGVVHCC